jgi:hypothetical protein
MRNINNRMLLTYPRSGSHYLKELINQKTGTILKATHDKEKVFDNYIISIIRNPKDTLKSKYAMQAHYEADKIFNYYSDDYHVFYKHLIDNASILINYNDLINETDKLIEYLFDYFNLVDNGSVYKTNLKDYEGSKYLVSSKTSDAYKNIDMYQFDLTECNKIYDLCLSKCIDIN